MNELDKPRLLRYLPVDPTEATLEILRRLGPLNEYELKVGLKSKYQKEIIKELIEIGQIVIIEEENHKLFGLPHHVKLPIDKGNIF